MKEEEKTFIKFTALQRRLLNEINRRHATELNSALEEISKEHNIDPEDSTKQYLVDKKMTGFNIIKIPSLDDKQKETKINEKKNGHSSEGEKKVE